MRKFRVDRNEDMIVKRRIIEQVAAYKSIPRHMNIISFLNMGYFVNKKSNSKEMFCFVYSFERA